MKKKLFNPNGTDVVSKRRIIKGDSTNLFNLNNIKYKWASSLYRVMMDNFWIPEKVNLMDDRLSYASLNESEKKSMKMILSFLIFLDSIQTNNIPNIKEHITAPEVCSLLSIQEYQEVVHSQSYDYILQSIIPSEERNEVYELWRENKHLFERNKHIAEIYQKCYDDPTDENLADSIIANYVLESIYFYNGFMFFYNLASRKLCVEVSKEIRYINRDELTHMDLFRNIIQEIQNENPFFFNAERVRRIFIDGANKEIEWASHVFETPVLGMSAKSTIEYTKYLANLRCQELGFGKCFDGNFKNPYKHLENISNENGDLSKQNFFEGSVTEYNHATAIEGWDEL